ncbi:MAG: tetratricopeptide repeat family protein [Deltaproteobacteria bacterium]|nr:tetratricopeptide repeat family protein [Deltaproteobacteria bacterium]
MPNYDGNKKKRPDKLIVAGVVTATVAIVLLVSFIYARPQVFQSGIFFAHRAINAFSHYVFRVKPDFYFLQVEKNGRDIQVGADEILEISYRDEFVIKSVGSDDLTGKYTSVMIEGMGNKGNQTGVLFRGIDLVNKIMKSDARLKDVQAVNLYRINVYYQKEMIAAVPLRIVIKPQDWLRFASENKDVGAQIEFLKKAVSQNSKDAGVRRILAGIYLKQNRIDEAVSLYEDVLRINPNDTAAMKELARCYLKGNQHDPAIRVLSVLVAKQPQDVETCAMLGLSFSHKKLWEKAAHFYLQALQIEPGNQELRMALAGVYENSGNEDAAAGQYRYIAEHSRDAAAAWKAMGDIYFKKRNYTRAIESYGQAVRIKPQDGAVHANMAAAYAGMGKLKEEMQHLQKAAVLMPDEPVVRFNLAAAYEKRKMTDEAVREYLHVLKINPEDADALERVADLAFKSKKYDQAVHYYEKLGKKYPQKASIFAKMGFAYGEMNQYARSAENYEKAISLGAKDQTMYNNLAYAYRKMGKEKEASRFSDKTSPGSKKAAQVPAGDRPKGSNNRQAIDHTNQSSLYVSRGQAYADEKNWDKAIVNYLIALRYEKKNDEIYAGLGNAYEKKGLYQKALQAYRSAYEINPGTRVAARIPKLRIQLLREKNKNAGENDEAGETP